MTNYTFGPFAGDGRHMLNPLAPLEMGTGMPLLISLPGTKPLKVTKSSARALIDRLITTKTTNHSAQGGTLWIPLLFCQINKIPYVLHAEPGLGYHLRITP